MYDSVTCGWVVQSADPTQPFSLSPTCLPTVESTPTWGGGGGGGGVWLAIDMKGGQGNQN